MKNKIRSALDKYFGFSDFRFGQDEIILSVLQGKDTLAVMPTGGGKSLCYQLPALMLEGTAIVISPLIALMKDQVDALDKRNYPATFINSSLTQSEIRNRINLISQGRIKLLYLAPERLESKQFLDLIQTINISFLAVDEAHCISEWGHDFRPSYLSIPTAFAGMERFPIIALTATATPEVQTDILNVLGIPRANRYIRGFDRPNLSYQTVEIKNKTDYLVKQLSRMTDGSSIIYCGSRKRVESFHEELLRKKIKVMKYHAGLSDSERKSSQDTFINTPNSAIIATNAFGMGIDKPNVRNVVHLDYTQSLEAYYQEAGRAGRDNQESDCLLLHNSGDVNLQHFFIKTTHPEKKDIIKVYDKLYDIAQVALGKTGMSAVYLSDAEIANTIHIPTSTASSVLKLFEKEKIIIKGSSNGFGKIGLTRNRDELFEIYNSLNAQHQIVLEALLRGLSREAFRNMIEFDSDHMIAKHNLDKETFNNSMSYFQSIGIINFVPPMSSTGISIIKERMDNRHIPIDFAAIDRRRDYAFKKFEMVRRYAQTTECKRNFILGYFGETDVRGTCGKCTSCKTPVRKQDSSEKDKFLVTAILASVRELPKSFGRKMICDFMRGRNTSKIKENNLYLASNFGCAKEFTEDSIMQVIQDLVESEYLTSASGVYPVIRLTEKGESLVSDYSKFKTTSIRKSRNPVGNELFDKLKALRLRIADANNMSAFQILTDRKLRKITEAKPDSLLALSRIEGLSLAFIDNFGAQFIYEINGGPVKSVNEKKIIYKEKSELHELINSGLGFSGIVRRLNLPAVDVAKEIQILIENEPALNLDKLIESELVNGILDFLKEYPSALLRDVRTYFGSKNDMPTLRVATAIARKKLKK